MPSEVKVNNLCFYKVCHVTKHVIRLDSVIFVPQMKTGSVCNEDILTFFSDGFLLSSG